MKNYDNIKDLYALADYLNEIGGWEAGIEDLCEERGWKYHDNMWDVASHNGELVTLSEVRDVYEVVPYEEDEEDEPEYVILKANAFARFEEMSDEAYNALSNHATSSIIDFDRESVRFKNDKCLIVKRDEYLKDKERYQFDVAWDATQDLRELLFNALGDIDCKYRIDTEDDILVETPSQDEVEKYL